MRWNSIRDVTPIGQPERDRQGKLASRRLHREGSGPPEFSFGQKLELRQLSGLDGQNAAERPLEPAGMVFGLQPEFSRNRSVVQLDVELVDFIFRPPWRFPSSVVDQVKPGDSQPQFRRHLALDELLLLFGGDPQVVPRNGRLKNLLPVVVGRFVAAQDFGVGTHGNRPCGQAGCEPRIGLFANDWSRVGRVVIGDRFLQQRPNPFRAAVVIEGNQRPRRIGDVEALGGVIEIVSRALPSDPPVEFPFGILLAAGVPLVECDRDEFVLEQVQDSGIGEGRLTVEHSVVSRTAQWVAIHRPDKERLPLLDRQMLGLQQIGLPGNASPRCIPGLTNRGTFF